MKKYLQIICFITLFSSLFYAQTTRTQFENFTEEDGLLQNTIRCVWRDHIGFLWIGTDIGLSRYDGYKFTHYYFDPDDNTSLSDPCINKIYEDKENHLWIGTNGGLNKYNRELDSFKRYVSDSDNPNSLSNNIVMCIYEDSKGVLWIGTDGGGLNRFDKNTDSFTSYTHNPNDISSISSNSIYDAIFEDKYGNLLVGTFGGGLNVFNRETQSFTNYKNNRQNPHSISDDRIYTVYLDKTGTTWIGTEEGLNKTISQNGKPDQLIFMRYKHSLEDPNSISNNKVTSICEDTNGDLLVGTYEGLNKLKRDKNIFIRYNDKIITKIYRDNYDLFWISTYHSGLYKLDSKKQQIKIYRNDPNDPHSLSNNTIWSFLEFNEKTIWIGTLGGLNIFNRESGDFIHFNHDDQNPSSLSDNSVIRIFRDHLGEIWIGTYNGLNKVVMNNENYLPASFIHYKNENNNPRSISGNDIIGICEDTLGNLWIGTERDGLNILKRDKDGTIIPRIAHFEHSPQDSNSLTSNRVWSLYCDKANNVWVGTYDGLDLYNRNKNNFSHFKNIPDDPTSLSYNWILTIYEDKSEVLWVGTEVGLNKYDMVSNKFKSYTVKNGLPSNTIYSIKEDDRGNLWIGTANGLSMFDPVTEIFNNYDANDGLQSNDFNEDAAIRCSNGELLFGGINGFNILRPGNLRVENSHIPTIVITSFMLNNNMVPIGYDTLFHRTILNKSIISTKEIILPYDMVNLSFEFSALDFTLPKENKYAYMLEGFEKNWNYTNADRRFANYTNLNPGEYIFRVKGSNNNGVWNEAGTSIKIIILPPLWKTIWAYLVYILLILSTIYITWKLQFRRIRIKHELEIEKFEAQKYQEVDELKSRFFTNISHEFRTPLTVITGYVNQIIEKLNNDKMKDDLNIINRNAYKLLELVNQLLDISKIESGKMKLHAAPQNIIPFLKALVFSFEHYAQRKNIDLKFNTCEDNIVVYVDREKIENIITNILSNAFKFTPEGGCIEVTVTKEDKYLEVTISDTGIGIPKEELPKIYDRFYQVNGSSKKEFKGTGIGLALTKELIELHKGKISVESEEGRGTSFTISIPLGKEYLNPDEIYETAAIKENEPELIKGSKFIEEKVIDKPAAKIISENNKPLLLIVEDNTDVRNYIKECLMNDYEVVEATDGEDGWNKSVKYIPEIIISDIMMPKMDGFELCSKLKADDMTSHIPVILLTAKASDADKREGIETGADEYIIKPFDSVVLKIRIKNLIEQRKRIHEHFKKKGLFELEESKVTSVDKKFLEKVMNSITENISNTLFSVESLSESLAMNRAVLHRKIVSLTGQPPVELIKKIRLTKAAEMIVKKSGNISEIALNVGFSNPAYFSECFKKEFGISPAKYTPKTTNH